MTRHCEALVRECPLAHATAIWLSASMSQVPQEESGEVGLAGMVGLPLPSNSQNPECILLSVTSCPPDFEPLFDAV
jgi:hypothetical protein